MHEIIRDRPQSLAALVKDRARDRVLSRDPDGTGRFLADDGMPQAGRGPGGGARQQPRAGSSGSSSTGPCRLRAFRYVDHSRGVGTFACADGTHEHERQIDCSGANYKKHVVQLITAQGTDETRGMSLEEPRVRTAQDGGARPPRHPLFFILTSRSSVGGPFDPVILPRDAHQLDWELELAAVIGRAARPARERPGPCRRLHDRQRHHAP